MRVRPGVGAKLQPFVSKHRWGLAFLGLVLVYTGSSLLFLSRYLYRLNPDGTAYMNIAQEYASGHIGEAINAYWGPLLSWLIAPLLALGISTFLATKLVAIATGIAALLVIWDLSKQLLNSKFVSLLATAILSPLIFKWSIMFITPDLLLAVLLLAFLDCLYKARKDNYSRKWLLLSGIFGGLAYLSKSFALFYVTVVYVSFGAVVVARDKNFQRLRKMALPVALTFLLITASWTTALSIKYGALTTGTSGAYNWNINNPSSPGHPMLSGQLMAPTSQHATSVWDDPSYIKTSGWDPLWPPKNLKYFVGRLLSNTANAKTSLSTASYIMLLSLVLGAFYVIAKKRYVGDKLVVVSILWTSLILLVGYLPIVVEDRYLITAFLLLGILPFVLAEHFRPYYSKAALGFIFFVIAVGLAHPSLADSYHLLKEPAPLYSEIAKSSDLSFLRGHRLASNSEWATSLYLSYDSGGKFYGVVEDERRMPGQLKSFGIDYFMVWGKETPKFIGENPPVVSDPKFGMRIFKVGQ